MTCKCGSERIMGIYGKCNDLAVMSIAHLDFEHEGYMPNFGVVGGDEFNLSICMDCGQIQHWTPITDEEVKDSEEYQEKEEQREIEKERVSKRVNGKHTEPAVFSMINVHENRVIQILSHAFGVEWRKNPTAREVLKTELESYCAAPVDGAERIALENLLRSLNEAR